MGAAALPPATLGPRAGLAPRPLGSAQGGLRPATLGPALCHRVPFSVHSAFDLVNIHLFHDASNLVAWETSPSVYAGIRHKALGYVLDR